MTSVIRVKRKLDCEPAEALLLARKKFKSENESPDVSSNIAVVIKIEEKVFHYAATVTPEIAHSQQVVADRVKEAIYHRHEQRALLKAASRKRKIPRFISSTCPNLPKIKHLKDATIAACQSMMREKCLNLSTDSKSNSNPEKFSNSPGMKIEDCEKCSIYHNDDHVQRYDNRNDSIDEIMCNNIKMMREKLNVAENPHKVQQEDDDDFVYDLYYCRNTAANWDMSELLYVQPYRCTEHDLLDASDSDDDVYEDEDDSNDEGNWRNDYPDDDDDDDSSKSSSSSEDNWERFVQQEEEDMENDEDDLDAGLEDDDFGQFGQEDIAQYDCNDDAIAEAFDAYDPADNGPSGGGGTDDF